MVLCLLTLIDASSLLSASAELLVFTNRMPFLSLNQQCQSTEGENIADKCIRFVTRFKYLGHIISNDFSDDENIERDL